MRVALRALSNLTVSPSSVKLTQDQMLLILVADNYFALFTLRMLCILKDSSCSGDCGINKTNMLNGGGIFLRFLTGRAISL